MEFEEDIINSEPELIQYTPEDEKAENQRKQQNIVDKMLRWKYIAIGVIITAVVLIVIAASLSFSVCACVGYIKRSVNNKYLI